MRWMGVWTVVGWWWVVVGWLVGWMGGWVGGWVGRGACGGGDELAAHRRPPPACLPLSPLTVDRPYFTAGPSRDRRQQLSRGQTDG